MTQAGAQPGTPHLALFLLGAPRIERDGQPLAFDTRKAMALLAVLAVTDRPHTRDALVGLLWPEYDEAHARATLRRTLSALNKALRGEALRAGRATIALERGTVWVDVRELAAQLASCGTHGHRPAEVCPACIGPLEAAVRLYTGDFLAGFSLRDSPEFDDWQMAQTQALRRDAASALERLARGLAAAGDYDRALGYARRWLALDRLHEPAHRLLMRLYAWAGQRAAASRQYRECVQVLQRELGVAPLEETTRLYESIKENRLPAPEGWAPAEEPAARTGARATVANEVGSVGAAAAQGRGERRAYGEDFPLVGREAELRALEAAYASVDAQGRGGQAVLVEGEAGIGKTRLADQLGRQARDLGAAVLAARCYEGETDLTYGPIIAALRAAIATRGDAWLLGLPAYWVSEVGRLLPELAGHVAAGQEPQPLETPGARSRFLEGVRRALLAACAGTPPGILFLDDMQWADGASLELLIYLIRRLEAEPLCILVTCRAESLAGGHPLRRAVAEQQRLGRGTTVTLERLDAAAIQALARAASDRSSPLPAAIDSPEGLDRLQRETEGVPLLLVEYLRGLATGTVKPDDTQWQPGAGVRQLLEARLSAVSETSRQLLSTAAVIGRSFDFDVLHAASGRSEDETVSALEELSRHGLVRELSGSEAGDGLRYDFTHEKLRALAYEETSLARRRLLHRRVAEALSRRASVRGELDSQPEQIAHHYFQAGDDATAAEYERIAGERARRLYAHGEAVAHFSMALALGHPDAAALHAALGDLHTLRGEYTRAITSYETAAALADVATLPTIEHLLGTVYARRGEWELAESHLAAALEALGAEDVAKERSQVLADTSLLEYHRGRAAQALELARRALTLAEHTGDGAALAQAHNMLGILATRAGDLPAAREHLERSLAVAERLGDLGARMAALNNLAQALAAEGDTAAAIERAQEALALSVAQGDRHREAALHNNLADLLHAAGRAEEALEHVRAAVTIYAEIGVEAGALQPAIWKLSEW